MADILNNASIYDLNSFIENIKSKYVEEDDLTLSMGIYGYLGDVNTTMLQNSIVMASEFANEAIPTRAKYNKNIIAHALNLGIDNINAVPAEMDVCIVIPENNLALNLFDNKFTWDREIPIMMGKYEMHPEYDIIITKVDLSDGNYVYTARYDISNNNPISSTVDETNPYLAPVARVNNNNEEVIVITCKLRQYEFKHINSSIINTNPILNKITQFEFENQMAGFDVDISNYDKDTIHLNPVYEGLYNSSTKTLNYCNYTYLDENRIRLTFNDTSALPNMNTDVQVNLWTCQGASGNFAYKDTVYMNPSSERFNYDRMTAMVIPISDSQYGIDAKNIDELKKIIPKEALARGSVTNITDINNFFNSIDYSTNKNMMYFFPKMDNPLHRLYYAYMVMTNGYNIIPTNTIPVNCERNDFDNISGNNYILNAGNIISYDTEGKVLHSPSSQTLAEINNSKFLYLNPFLCIINKSPLYVSYFINFMDTNKFIKFEYINESSTIQFINTGVHWYKHFFTDNNTYKLEFELTQNITMDLGIVHYDDNLDPSRITSIDVKPILVLYKNGKPYRWLDTDFDSYDSSTYTFKFTAKMVTNNMIDSNNCIRINDLNQINSEEKMYGFVDKNTEAKLFIFVKDNERESAGKDRSKDIIPEKPLDGYSLTNIYGISNGLDFMYDYSDIIQSNIKISKNTNSGLTYLIDKVPVIGYTYCNTEERLQDFILDLERKRIKIEDCLEVIEDNFGIDLKLFNTYGPSKLFKVDDTTLLNKTNLSITFNIKFNIITETETLLTKIKEDIRSYIEDITQIKDLHIPNLITYITDKYSDYLTYFEFVDFNGYGPGVQHIYRQDENLIGKIPEFLNINTANTENNTLDINLIVK